ncbi:MAG: histidinol-phosphate transaminase [Treponema porcinum]|uniref:Histidinol-phosphate aminotransferase n=2 Tax=Treponema TaxID=157 RepID=A0A1T4LZ53_TREPO|nr:histidinol-phosphate transaminase [Treponema porcinum]MCI5644235.1 histidinol-phosphate transaminase [Treponema porcinum]MCI6482535.1 histidinol-phosphate transaminase [Treponema porcinum]MDY4468146.1 histidinol-phosphate transaminase [Treponema porcinum]MDY5121107.1 histidinol-phosphate transaminase [Treponema porcinum]SJZ60019.1 histidinol-phosphate aminotransferase [Treponema porcinum]
MISERMKNLHPYVPGEQPKDRVYIKLNANENPYPPAPEVIKATGAFVKKNPMKLALYPDPDSLSLRASIADMLNKTGGVLCRASVSGKKCEPAQEDKIPFVVTPDMIYAGNGSDEVLSFVFYAFFDSANRLVLPEFTYSFYPVYAGFYNIPTDVIPLNADWTLDTAEMLSRAKANGSGIIFANPNAPTGRGLTRDEVRAMIKSADSDKVFVVDEAYCDFGGESCIPLLSEFRNLVIVRTFSKSLCSAGMRLGYIVANPELVNTVTTVKNSLNHFPVDAVAQAAGKAACENPWYYAECARKVACERDDFIRFLSENGWNVIPSQTNFVFAQKPGMGGEEVYQRIKQEGILVRHFSTKGIEDYVRITIGTKKQMNELKRVIGRLQSV